MDKSNKILNMFLIMVLCLMVFYVVFMIDSVPSQEEGVSYTVKVTFCDDRVPVTVGANREYTNDNINMYYSRTTPTVTIGDNKYINVCDVKSVRL